MNSSAFQLYKVKRVLRSQGKPLQFQEPNLNEFKEPNGETISHEVVGLFHETSGYATVTADDASSVSSRASPMVLALWESAKDIKQGWTVLISGTLYEVQRVQNLQQADLFAEISLKEIQHGK